MPDSPAESGSGFEFVDQVKGGAIPYNFMPAVEKGVRMALESGVVAGYPVVDLRVIVYDGKHHTVDSKEIAFITAGRKAFMAAVRAARRGWAGPPGGRAPGGRRWWEVGRTCRCR